MDDKLILKNHLKETRIELKLSQSQLADMVGVSRNTISSIEYIHPTMEHSWGQRAVH